MMPSYGTASAAPSTPVPGVGPTWSVVPAGHGAGLLPRLCHRDFSIPPHQALAHAVDTGCFLMWGLVCMC